MIKNVVRTLMFGGLALASAVVVVPQAAAATPAARTVADCMDIAVVEHDADPWIAHDACDAAELTTCYRIFRNAYGRQLWALEACRARTD
ncbi:hypothetical protein [Amycolatopsis speibonae]|uniref:Uncharacterized protein n=1 Tax=Amycolatopsis speibonae TaxID=1450224 RepID=A0ABV7P0U4_9PSEU